MILDPGPWTLDPTFLPAFRCAFQTPTTLTARLHASAASSCPVRSGAQTTTLSHAVIRAPALATLPWG